MQDKPLIGKTIAIMVANGFDENEFAQVQRKLVEAGATSKVISRAAGLVNGWYDGTWGHFFPVDTDLADVLAIDYHGLVVPGGARGVEKLADEAHAMRILKAFMRADMPVALIGDGVGLLTKVEMAKGRTLTSSEEVSEVLKEAGASWEAGPVIEEGGLVTATGAPAVDEAMALLFPRVATYEEEVNKAA
jgi:protease I